MAERAKLDLRIYCICGQKMKVAENMFGRSAKCVACRQKIRIPRLDEIPPDTREIHLTQHPEFLRKGRPRAARAAEPERDVVVLGEEPAPEEVIALDILEPLRLICSLQYKLGGRRTTSGRDDGDSDGEGALDGVAILTRVRDARARLDDALRERLREVSTELDRLKEELIQLALAVRTGDRDFLASRDRVLELRGRRDRLERRRQNLRGWLACDDPFLAGGYYGDVTLDRIPAGDIRITFPPEPERLRPLIDEHADTLRSALYRREQAERKLSETERLVAEGKTGWNVLQPDLAASVSEKTRADAAVAFARDRLERLSRDYVSDTQAIQAQLQHARGRLAVKALDRSRYEALRRDLRGAADNVARANRLVARALRATRAQDVPHGLKTTRGDDLSGVGIDSWIVWGAALLLLVGLFVPTVGGESPLTALRATPQSPLRLLVFGFTASAILFSATAFLPHQVRRGMLLWAEWFGVCLAGTLWWRGAVVAVDPLGARASLSAPGIVLAVVAAVAVVAAALIALASRKRLFAVGLSGTALAAAGFLALGWIGWAGYGKREPYVTQESRTRHEGSTIVYETSITVGNKGDRAFRLSSGTRAASNAYRYDLERQMGTGVWTAVGPPEAVRGEGLPRAESWPNITLRPGAEAVLVYRLLSGQYRVRLLPSSSSEQTIVEAFTLAAAPEPVVEEQVEGDLAAEAPGDRDERSIDIPESAPSRAVPSQVTVELRGLATAEGREPRFTFVVKLPDGTVRQRDATLAGVLHDTWKLAEYNPENQTVTLASGRHILILHRGEPTALPVLPGETGQQTPSEE